MNRFALLMLLVLVPHWGALAQSYYHTEPSVAAFGGAVAIGDGYAAIAEPSGFKHPGTVNIYAVAGDAWQRTHRLRGPDAAVNDGFGQALALSGNTLVVSSQAGLHFLESDGSAWTEVFAAPVRTAGLALSGDLALAGVPGRGETMGRVHVFRSVEGRWAEAMQLTGEQASFGRSVALDGAVALIGSGEQIGFYRWDGDTLALDARISSADLGLEGQFSASVHLKGDEALVGASASRQVAESVQVFRKDGSWRFDRQMQQDDPESRSLFGASVQVNDAGYWVGAPFADRGQGRVYLFPRSGEAAHAFTPASVEGRTGFGMALAAAEDMVLIGMPQMDYGEGGVAWLAKDGDAWVEHDVLVTEPEVLDAVLGQGARCDTGDAAGYACGQVDLVSFLPLADLGTARGVRLSDVWGWTDPETGREFGLVGHLEGTAFVDLSDPSVPVFLGELPRTEGSPGSTWRDIKVYRDHAYIVADGAGAHGMQVFDLSRLRSVEGAPATFDVDAHYDGIHSSHNIVINEETGFAYAVGASGGGESCGGGLHMIDIREPLAPTFAGCFADETTGRRKTGYSHDAQCVIYHGPDAAYQGREICIGSNETAISIADITDKENPAAISSGTYPDASYVHQGWLSEDHTFFYQNDELDEISGRVDRTRTLVWDVSDLDDPVLANQYLGPTSATDHNLYVRDDLMYQTNNASGLRILDITDRSAPREVGFFDTTPYGTDEAGFNGTWSSYPYFKSGIIVVTSRREGLYILRKQTVGS